MTILIVKVKKPSRASMKETKEYIYDALGSWGGQRFSGDEYNDPDPLFDGIEVLEIKPAKVSK